MYDKDISIEKCNISSDMNKNEKIHFRFRLSVYTF